MHTVSSRLQRRVWFTAFTIALALGFSTKLSAQSCSYYASPNGSGNGSSSSPFQITRFWSVARAGSTLCLFDGTYTGINSMINPPQGMSGTSGSRITVRAINDGAVLIDGQSSGLPILLRGNDYFTIEGINAANSSQDVVSIFPGSDNNIIRRVVAWNAASDNSMIFSLWEANSNLLEDVAGFGPARKIFQSYLTNGTTIRRAWAMWNYSSEVPSNVYTIAYGSYNSTYENVIGTWDSDPGAPYNDQYGIFTANQMTDGGNGICSNSKVLGSIAYTLSNQNSNLHGALQGGKGIDCLTFENVAIFMGAGNLATSLTNLDPALGGPSNGRQRLRNTTMIQPNGATPWIEDGWTVSNQVVTSRVSGAPSIWNGSGSNGARVCYQYQNGSLTSTPLWPWPMDSRISSALSAAGRRAINVTSTMESIFGSIPGQCSGGGGGGGSTTVSSGGSDSGSSDSGNNGDSSESTQSAPATPSAPSAPSNSPDTLIDPTGLQTSCNGDGTFTVSWDDVPGAENYYLRIDNQSNGSLTWNFPDFYLDHYNRTSFTGTVVRNQLYVWWVHGANSTDGIGPSSHGSLVCR